MVPSLNSQMFHFNLDREAEKISGTFKESAWTRQPDQPGVNVIKPFFSSSSLLKNPNKLECFSVASLSTLGPGAVFTTLHFHN
jgi:hypothetical protein